MLFYVISKYRSLEKKTHIFILILGFLALLVTCRAYTNPNDPLNADSSNNNNDINDESINFIDRAVDKNNNIGDTSF